MLVKPNLPTLMEGIDARYTLVIIGAQRARQIMAKQPLSHENPVSVALQEVADGNITWEKNYESTEAELND